MLVWDNKYVIGERFLDVEHEVLFEIANELCALGESEEEEFRRAYSELLRYQQLHFNHEETFLSEIGYKEYLAHAGEHAQIFTNYENLMFSGKSFTEIRKHFVEVLTPNIEKHILDEAAEFRVALELWKKDDG